MRHKARVWTPRALIVTVVLEIVTVGAGMGVPLFAILLGFAIGWWLGRRVLREHAPDARALRGLLSAAVVPTLFTLGLMVVIWLPQIRLLYEWNFDVRKWGIPLLLFEPVPSFWAWMALMVVISPVLQWMAVVVGGVLRMAGQAKPDSEAPALTGQASGD